MKDKPTLDDLRAYASAIGFAGFDAQQFLDHYEMVGWVVGRARTPMASWRAAVRTWQRNQAAWGGAAVPPRGSAAVPSGPPPEWTAARDATAAAVWDAIRDHGRYDRRALACVLSTMRLRFPAYSPRQRDDPIRSGFDLAYNNSPPAPVTVGAPCGAPSPQAPHA